MTIDDEGAGTVRARLDHLAATAPPVHFTAEDVLRRGRRRRQVHRGALATGAAAALALVMAVPTVTLRGDGSGIDTAGPAATGPSRTAAGPSPSPTAPGPVAPSPSPVETSPGPVAPSPSPIPTSPSRTATASAPPTVSGLTPAQAERIARSCARTLGDDPRLQDVARVYNLVRDAAGTHALVYAPGTYLSCDVSGPPARYDAQVASGGAAVTEWLPGALALDASSLAEGGTPRKGDPGGPAAPGYYLAEGRVTSAVARLTVSFGADRVEVRPQNRTFLARLVYSTTWRPDPSDMLSITAYDARGRLLTAYDQNGSQPCYRTPGGTVISGRSPVPTPGCKPAQPWL